MFKRNIGQEPHGLCSGTGPNLPWLQRRFRGVVVTLVPVRGNVSSTNTARSCGMPLSCLGTWFPSSQDFIPARAHWEGY